MIVVNLGVLLHPEHDDFKRDQARRSEHAIRRADEQERAITSWTSEHAMRRVDEQPEQQHFGTNEI